MSKKKVVKDPIMSCGHNQSLKCDCPNNTTLYFSENIGDDKDESIETS